MAANRFFESDGRLKLDVGPFVSALEYGCGRKAKLVGKPSLDFFRSAVAKLDLEPGEVAMVGDDLESDVGGAMDAGLTGILVKTGKYRPDTEKDRSFRPDYSLDSIAGLPSFLGIG